MRCDGGRPKCSNCQARGQACDYPQDARKTVLRARKEDVRSLLKQIEALRQQIPQPESPVEDLNVDTPQVYGATSLLHDQSSDSPLTNSQHQGVKGRAREKPSIDDTRDRLVAYAATRRQEEIALHSSPSVIAQIDFDGVPLDMAIHLLDLHWNRQHLSYLVTYRPAIMDSLVTNGPYMNRLLLNAIYLQSSLYSDRVSLRSDPDDPQTVGRVFYDRFKSLLIHHIDKPTIPTAVALLTCGASLVPHGRQSAGWVYCGMAYRMITDLGCHLDIQQGSQSELGLRHAAVDVEIRQRLYWGAYVGDKFQSLFLGRSPSITRLVGKVSREYLDSYEEMEEWKPYVDPVMQPLDATVPAYEGHRSYALSTFRCLVELCDTAHHIMDAFYSVNSAETAEEVLCHARQEIREELRQWKHSLPSWLQFDPATDRTPPPHQLTPQYESSHENLIHQHAEWLTGFTVQHTGHWSS